MTEKHEHCDCSVCQALEEKGLQVFRLTWDTDDNIGDHNYFAFDKTQEEFREAVGAAKSRIDDLACTSEEIWQILHDEMKERGFLWLWQFESGWVSVTEKPPMVRGYTFEINDYSDFN